MKKIIFNKTLREIGYTLKRRNIIFPDYVISKKLLKSIRTPNEGINIVTTLLKIQLTPEKFDFMLDLYVNDKELYEKLKGGKIDNYNIDDLKYVYTEYPDLLNILLEHPNLVKKEMVNFYGNEFLLANQDILSRLEQISVDEIKPYIDNLKKYPQNFEILLEIKKQCTGNSKLEKLYEHIDNPDLLKIYQIINGIKDKTLQGFLIDNIDNHKILEFGKQIIDNFNGQIDGNLFYYKDYIAKLKELSPAGDINTIKQFIIYQLENISDDSLVRNIMLKALLNIERADDFQRLIFKTVENDFMSRELREKVLLATKLLDEKLSKAELFHNFKQHYMTDDLNINYDEAYHCIRNYNSELIKSNLTNIDTLKEVMPLDYTFLDEQGNIKSKKITIKIIDDPNFHVLIHGIGHKDENNMNKITNYEIGNKLVNNPNLWQIYHESGNPQISTSLFNGCLNPFASEVILGFSHFSDERLISTYVNDGATKMKKSQKDIIAKKELFCFADYNMLEKSFAYNEVLLQRYKDGNPLLPDYIILQSDCLASQIEGAKKWAAFYDIPIVIIDKQKIGQIRKNNIVNLVNKIIIDEQLTDEDITQLQYEIRIANWCYKYDEKNYIDPYTIIRKLQNSISITQSNAIKMLELMESYNYVHYNSFNDEDISNAKVSDIEAFLLPHNSYARPYTVEEEQISVKRQQETAEYILKCKNVILALTSSLEQSSIRK